MLKPLFKNRKAYLRLTAPGMKEESPSSLVRSLCPSFPHSLMWTLLEVPASSRQAVDTVTL